MIGYLVGGVVLFAVLPTEFEDGQGRVILQFTEVEADLEPGLFADPEVDFGCVRYGGLRDLGPGETLDSGGDELAEVLPGEVKVAVQTPLGGEKLGSKPGAVVGRERELGEVVGAIVPEVSETASGTAGG